MGQNICVFIIILLAEGPYKWCKDPKKPDQKKEGNLDKVQPKHRKDEKTFYELNRINEKEAHQLGLARRRC